MLSNEKRGASNVTVFQSIGLASISRILSKSVLVLAWAVRSSVADQDPQDPYVFGLPGSGSISTRYGFGSFYNQAKRVRKTLIPTVL